MLVDLLHLTFRQAHRVGVELPEAKLTNQKGF